MKNNSELEETLNKMESREFRNMLKKNREKFIYEHAYKIDGKSTERVMSLVERMIGKSR